MNDSDFHGFDKNLLVFGGRLIGFICLAAVVFGIVTGEPFVWGGVAILFIGISAFAFSMALRRSMSNPNDV